MTSITNQTYTNLPYNPPNLVSNVVNGPNGPTSYTMGNGLNVYRSYDSLGRPAQLWVCNGPAAGNCSGGTALYGTASQWKGSQMQSQSDTVPNQGFSFGYTDGFNRLTSRTATSGPAQNYTYSYGVYGNRVSQTPLNGGYSFNPTFNPANNQITTSGYTYDAAGNMTNDSVNAYTFDAEGNVTKVVGPSGTSQYVYDVFNHRVHVQTPTATTEYTFDYAGRRVSTWYSAAANSGYEGRIYWDGQLFGYRAIDGNTYFDHQDLTGTERMRTTYSGAAASKYLSLPWGDGYAAANTTSADDQDNNHFAGLERDSESNTEHAQFRNYASVQGRWLSPDPYLGSYDFTNPQSFNRYTYALNNPLSLVDPAGLLSLPTPPGPPPPIINPLPPQNPLPPGCVSFGTQGCVQANCGNSGINCPSGGGNTGAPSNGPQTGVPANPCASAGGAPNPSAYAAAGTIAQVSEFLSPGGLLVNAAYLSGFRRGGALDAQPLGASRAYGNYVFGAYLSAAGIPLSVGLGGANGYAAVSSAQYPGFSMDPNYPAVPQANVANIINGYNAQHNGTLCHK